MKKLICGLTAVLMILLSAGAALAGEGDRLIEMTADENMFVAGGIDNVILLGQKVYLFENGWEPRLVVYDLEKDQKETYSMQEMNERMNGLTAETETFGENEGEDAGENAGENAGGAVYESIACWFPMEGELCAVVNRTVSDGQETTLDGGHVRKLVLAEGKADLGKEDILRLDWTAMTETAGTWTGSRNVSACEAGGDRLYLQVYDDSGNTTLVIYDLKTGEYTEQMVQDLSDLSSTEDGTLLITQYNWGEKAEQIISKYDPETESAEPLARFSLDEGSVSSVALDTRTNTLYFARNGEIFAAPNLDISQAAAVNNCPANARSFSKLTQDGRLLIWDYSTAILRNTDPALRGGTTLRIRPYAGTRGLDAACYSFSTAHSDVDLVREDYGDESTLLQAMMNRDDRVDVYLMSMDSTVFSALYERGFLADLSGSEYLTGEIGKMYPAFAQAAEPNGKLSAIPLAVSGNGIGYRPETLKLLGMTEADLPRTWEGFFDFLGTLPEKLESAGARAFELYTTQGEVKLSFLDQILTQFGMLHENESFGSETVRRLADRIDKIDFEALQVLTNDELTQVEEENSYSAMGGEKPALFTYAEYTLASYDEAFPLRLALAEGEEAVLPVSVNVAFVNPYSSRQEIAASFLETLTARMDAETRYTLYPDLNEPVRYPNHEEERKSLQKWAEMARKQAESADEEERENWASIAESYEKELQDYDETHWMISPEAIRSYRERAAELRPMTWNYYRAISSAEGSEQFWELRQGYADGHTSAAELLDFMDRKVQMMRLEGN